MQHIFTCLDNRDFLRDYYDERKLEAPWFSLRVFGSKLGLNAAYLLRIMQNLEHLSVKKVPSVSEYFGFQPVENEY